MRKLLSIFPSKRCKSMIASNKQREGHNNLATIQKEKLKGNDECTKNLQVVKTQCPNEKFNKIG